MSNETASSDNVPPDPSPSLQDGLEAFEAGNYDRAAEILAGVLEEMSSKLGELSESCALPNYYYGVSLLNIAQSSQEVFAETEDKSEAEELQSDLSLAWEALECARKSFELAGIESNLSYLSSKISCFVSCDISRSDVHIALGDVASESSNFETAFDEYTKAISYLDRLCEKEKDKEDGCEGFHRRYGEVFFKSCRTQEFLENPEEAAKYCDKAIESIRLELAIKQGTEEETGLKEIEKDLVERRNVIEISIREYDQVKHSLRQMFEQNATPEPKEKELPAVNLGIVGRGKRRLQMTPIQEEDEAVDGDGDSNSPLQKRAASLDGEDEKSRSNKKIRIEETTEPKDETSPKL